MSQNTFYELQNSKVQKCIFFQIFHKDNLQIILNSIIIGIYLVMNFLDNFMKIVFVLGHTVFSSLLALSLTDETRYRYRGDPEKPKPNLSRINVCRI